MNSSILDSIKKALGAENIKEFDQDLILHINGALGILTQNGIGPVKGFRITGSDQLWEDFITNNNPETLEMCKEFVYLKVKIIWDSNSLTSTVISALKEEAKELLWRICAQTETDDFFETNKEE